MSRLRLFVPLLLVCACVLPNDVVGVTGADGGFGGGGTGSNGTGGTAFVPAGTAAETGTESGGGDAPMPPEPDPCTVGICTCTEDPCYQVCEPIVQDTPCALVCPSGSECWFECPDGDCEFVCQPDSICHLDCAGGGCSMNCTFADSCEMTCSPDPEDEPCLGNCSADVCILNCPAGGCTLDCLSAGLCSTTDCEAECSVACNNVVQCEGACEDVNVECPLE